MTATTMMTTTSTSRASFAERTMTPIEHHELGPGVDAYFSGRRADGPASAIASDDNLAHHRPHDPSRLAAARAGVASRTRTELDRWITMRQVHGAAVATVGSGPGHEVRGVDAAVTREHDLSLVVMVADCVPVLLAGPSTVAAVHAGWRGVVAGVVDAAVLRIGELDGADAQVTAVVGPSIGPCCYEVGEEVATEVGRRAPSSVTSSTSGRTSVDLDSAVRGALRAHGVRVVDRAATCTRCTPGWFSHRADPTSGRQVGIVVRRGRTGADRVAGRRA
jgi:YfiH family protein